jgi:hypothetical protein
MSAGSTSGTGDAIKIQGLAPVDDRLRCSCGTEGVQEIDDHLGGQRIAGVEPRDTAAVALHRADLLTQQAVDFSGAAANVPGSAFSSSRTLAGRHAPLAGSS